MNFPPSTQDALDASDVRELLMSDQMRNCNAPLGPTYNVVCVFEGTSVQLTLPVCASIQTIEAARYLRDVLNGQLLASEPGCRFYIEEVGLTPVDRIA